MSGVVLSGDISGAVTLAVPAVAGTNTVTIAAQTGTLHSAAPSFSYYGAGTQTVSGYAKILVTNKEWDTANCVSSSTFTPTVAGYYQLNGQVSATNNSRTQARIYKNGSVYKVGNDVSGYQAAVSCIVYANGTTDYFELWGYTGVSNTLNGDISSTYFQGALIRGA